MEHTPTKGYNEKIKKISVYLGYDLAGQSRLDKLHAIAKEENKNITTLIVDLIKTKIKDF